MQDRNELLEILNAKVGSLDDLAKEPMPAKAVQRTIALLPQKGEVVKLRGLDFTVRFVNNRTGELRLTLTRDAEHRNGAVLPQQTCPVCNGSGVMAWGEPENIKCRVCKGTGHV